MIYRALNTARGLDLREEVRMIHRSFLRSESVGGVRDLPLVLYLQHLFCLRRKLFSHLARRRHTPEGGVVKQHPPYLQ